MARNDEWSDMPSTYVARLALLRHSLSLPVGFHLDQPNKTIPPSGGHTKTKLYSQVPWTEYLNDYVAPSTTVQQVDNSVFDNQPTSKTSPPRLIFFGEQHHQPAVVKSQTQTLHSLHRWTTCAKPKYRINLILEHFSILDQPLLDEYRLGSLSFHDLAERYRKTSDENFDILNYYAPLLEAAKDLQVAIWGGFPPRAWAKSIFRGQEGIETVKKHDQQRYDSATVQSRSPPPPFNSWHHVTHISQAHRTFLGMLMKPEVVPRFPSVPDAVLETYQKDLVQSIQRVSNLPAFPCHYIDHSPIKSTGFEAAQLLKDSYLAHVTAWVLSGQASLPNDSNTPEQVVDIAYVVCGLGHCEYGLGAPERTVQILKEHYPSVLQLLPYVIAAKPHDSAVWLGLEGLDYYKVKKEPNMTNQPSLTPSCKDPIQGELKSPFDRPIADAVFLYEWQD